MSEKPSFEGIMQLGTAFWASKTLLSAIELGLFTNLAQSSKDCETLTDELKLHPRSARDFFDALVALKILHRTNGLYSNTQETDYYLDRNKDTYIGGMLEMCNSRLYYFWGSLTEALRTGKPQNEIKDGDDPFAALYSDPERMRGFMQAMTGISMGTAHFIAQKFPWENYSTFADIGTAQGLVPVVLADTHPHLTGIGFDLEATALVFDEYVRKHGMEDRVKHVAGDFFEVPLPEADVLIMGHILHDWSIDEKILLMTKAYEAIPDGGALIVYEAIIDDERKRNAPGLLMSLNMLIETPGGFDYTGADCMGWMKDIGFSKTYVEDIPGPEALVIGIK